MSELVNRIRVLQRQISELEDMVADERRRYVSEVDHSEDMAFILSGLSPRDIGEYGESIANVLVRHQNRRLDDESLPPLPRSSKDFE